MSRVNTKFSQKDISTEKLNEFFGAIENPKYLILCKTAYYFCLRRLEVCRLNIADIDFDSRVIFVRKQKNKALGFNEPYPIPNCFLEELRSYIISYKDRIMRCGGYLFFAEPARRNGKPFRKEPYISGICVWNFINRLRQKIHLQEDSVYKQDVLGRKLHKFCFHALKAKRIKDVHRVTGDIVQTQCLAHHEDFKTTLRYIGNPIHDFDMKMRVLAKMEVPCL